MDQVEWKSGRFKFQKLAARINKIDVDVTHKVSKVVEADNLIGMSFVEDGINRWSQLDMSPVLQAFFTKIKKYSVSLPLVILHQNDILALIFETMDGCTESQKPAPIALYDMMVRLAKDTGQKGIIAAKIVECTKRIVTGSINEYLNPSNLESVLQSAGTIFRTLEKIATSPATTNALIKECLPLLCSEHQYLRELSAVPLSFLLRKQQNHDDVVHHILSQSLIEDFDPKDGLARILFGGLAGPKNTIHSGAMKLLHSVMKCSLELQRKMGKEEHWIVVQELFSLICHHIGKESADQIWQLLLEYLPKEQALTQYVESSSKKKGKETTNAALNFSYHLLSILESWTTYKKGHLITPSIDPRLLSACSDMFELVRRDSTAGSRYFSDNAKTALADWSIALIQFSSGITQDTAMSWWEAIHSLDKNHAGSPLYNLHDILYILYEFATKEAPHRFVNKNGWNYLLSLIIGCPDSEFSNSLDIFNHLLENDEWNAEQAFTEGVYGSISKLVKKIAKFLKDQINGDIESKEESIFNGIKCLRLVTKFLKHHISRMNCDKEISAIRTIANNYWSKLSSAHDQGRIVAASECILFSYMPLLLQKTEHISMIIEILQLTKQFPHSPSILLAAAKSLKRSSKFSQANGEALVNLPPSEIHDWILLVSPNLSLPSHALRVSTIQFLTSLWDIAQYSETALDEIGDETHKQHEKNKKAETKNATGGKNQPKRTQQKKVDTGETVEIFKQISILFDTVRPCIVNDLDAITGHELCARLVSHLKPIIEYTIANSSSYVDKLWKTILELFLPHALVGLLWRKFSPMWSRSIGIMGVLAHRLGKTKKNRVFLVLWDRQMQAWNSWNSGNKSKAGENEEIDDDEEQDSVTTNFEESLKNEGNIWIVHDELSTDVVTFSSECMNALKELVEFTQQSTSLVSPAFLSFVDDIYLPLYDNYDEHDGDIDEPEVAVDEVEENQPKESLNKKEKEKEKESVHRGTIVRRLISFLELFSLFANYLSIHSSEKVEAVFEKLLARADPNIHLLALKCVFTRIKLSESIRNTLLKLTDETTLHQAITGFEINSIPENEKPVFLRLFMPIFYGKMFSKPKHSLRGTRSLAGRRRMISTLLTTGEPDDLKLFFDYFLKPLELSEGVPIEDILLLPMRLRVRFVTIATILAVNIGNLNLPYLFRIVPLLQKVTLTITVSDGDLDSKYAVKSRRKQETFVRNSAMNCLMELLARFPVQILEWFDAAYVRSLLESPHWKLTNDSGPSVLLRTFGVASEFKEMTELLSQFALNFIQLIPHPIDSVASMNVSIITNLLENANKIRDQSPPNKATLAFPAPYVDDILDVLCSKIGQRAEPRKAHSGKFASSKSIRHAFTSEASKKDVQLLSLIAPFASNSERASRLASIGVPLLKAFRLRNEEFFGLIVNCLLPIIDQIRDASPYLLSIAQLFEITPPRRQRENLCVLVGNFAEAIEKTSSELCSTDESHANIASLVVDANSYDRTNMNVLGYDYKRQISAQTQLCKVANQGAMSIFHCKLVIPTYMYWLENAELGIRTAASSVLIAIIEGCKNIPQIKELVIERMIEPGIRKRLSSSNGDVRDECWRVLAVILKNYPTIYPDLQPLVTLSNSDVNDQAENRFNNIASSTTAAPRSLIESLTDIQLPIRRSALNTISAMVTADSFQKTTLILVLLPYLLAEDMDMIESANKAKLQQNLETNREKYKSKNPAIVEKKSKQKKFGATTNQTIQLAEDIGSVIALMLGKVSFSSYMKFFRIILKNIRNGASSQENERGGASLREKMLISLLIKLIEQLRLPAEAADENKVDTNKETEEEVDLAVDEIDESADFPEHKKENEPHDTGENGEKNKAKSLRRVVLSTIHSEIVPKLFSLLGKRDKIRVSVALALVKLIKIITGNDVTEGIQGRDGGHLYRLIGAIVSQLKNREQFVRDKARKTLQLVMNTIGSQVTPLVIKQLKFHLNEGFTLLVLPYTLYNVLRGLVEYQMQLQNPASSQIDPDEIATAPSVTLDSKEAVGPILDICFEDILGEASRKRGVKQIATAMDEAETCKSFKTISLLASIIKFPDQVSLLIDRVRWVLEENISISMMKKMNAVLNSVKVGISKNRSATPSNLLMFVHNVFSTFSVGKARIERKLLEKKEQDPESDPKVDSDTKLFGDEIEESSPHDQEEGDSGDAIKRRRLQSKTGDYWIVQPEPKYQKQKALRQSAGSSTHYHVLAEFGLKTLQLLIRKSKFDINDVNQISMLDPLLPMIVQSLQSTVNEEMIAALHVITAMLYLPLPSIPKVIKKIISCAFNILKRENVENKIKLYGPVLDLVSCILRNVTIPEAILTNVQLKVILKFVEKDIEDERRQRSSFGLLKAILQKRLVVGELYDVMRGLGRVMLTSHMQMIRDKARQLFVIFLLFYPLGTTRVRQHFDFLIKNAQSYQYNTGRVSALLALYQLVLKLPLPPLTMYSSLIFVPVMRLASVEESNECKKAATEILKSLIQRLSNAPTATSAPTLGSSNGETALAEQTDVIVGENAKVVTEPFAQLSAIVSSWILRKGELNPNIGVLKVGTQALSLMIEGIGNLKKLNRLVPNFLDLISQTILSLSAEDEEEGEDEEGAGQAMDDDDESGNQKNSRKGKWIVGYFGLNALEAVLNIAPNLVVNPSFRSILYFVESLLLHRHMWIRSVASRIVGIALSYAKTVLQEKEQEQNQSHMVLLGQWLGHSGAFPTLLRKTCAMLSKERLKTRKLCDQIARNIVALTSIIQQYPDLSIEDKNEKWVEDSEEKDELEEEAENEDVSDEDDVGDHTEDENGVEEDSKNEQMEEPTEKEDIPPILKWLFHRLSYLARSKLNLHHTNNSEELALRESEQERTRCILRCFAALATVLPVSVSNQMLLTMLHPLFRITVSTGKDTGQTGDLVPRETLALAQEVVELLKKKVGPKEFAAKWMQVTESVSSLRKERRRKRLISKVLDPAKSAKRKQKKHKQGREAKKRKIDSIRVNRSRIKVRRDLTKDK